MAKYPIYLDLEGRHIVLVGGGTVALRKAEVLLGAGARLVIIAEQTNEALTVLGKQGRVELVRGKYAKQYITEAVLVIAATNNRQVNEQIYRDCQSLEVLCNVVDDPDLCDFFVPAVIRRGDLQIAIGTDGYCPAYAGHLRKRLEAIITEEHGRFLAELEGIRRQIIEALTAPAERKALLGELVDDSSFEYFKANGPNAWRERAEGLIKERTAACEG